MEKEEVVASNVTLGEHIYTSMVTPMVHGYTDELHYFNSLNINQPVGWRKIQIIQLFHSGTNYVPIINMLTAS